MSKDERTYYILVTLGVIAVIVAMISSHISGKGRDGVALPETEAVETVTEAETLIFEPIETAVETETVEADTSEASPKTGENAAINADTQENLAETPYKTEDLIYLAKIVENEAGSDYCTDEHQRYVASVALNRVASPRFPGDTILEIALCGYGDGNPIQYMYALDPNEGKAAFWNIVPSERAIQNARYVLENGVLDDTVIWQANFVQGSEVVKKFTYDFAVPPTTYICK